MNPKIRTMLILIFLSIFVLFGCAQKYINETQQTPNVEKTKSVLISTASVPTQPPSPTITQQPQQPELTLTYSMVYDQSSSIFEITVGCLDENSPCFGDPTLLFSEDFQIDLFSWAPDGSKIVFGGYLNSRNIYISDWNGAGKTLITDAPGWNIWPSWSLNKQEIIYQQKDADGYMSFIVYTLANGPINKLLDDKNSRNEGFVSIGMPKWANNDQEIIFTAVPGDSIYDQIFSYDIAAKKARQLTFSPVPIEMPSVSADNSAIIFTRGEITPDEILRSVELVKLDRRTGQESIIYKAKKGQRISFPSWSPIGNWILFGLDKDIYIIKPDGSHLINITNRSSMNVGFPAWRLIQKP